MLASRGSAAHGASPALDSPADELLPNGRPRRGRFPVLGKLEKRPRALQAASLRKRHGPDCRVVVREGSSSRRHKAQMSCGTRATGCALAPYGPPLVVGGCNASAKESRPSGVVGGLR